MNATEVTHEYAAATDTKIAAAWDAFFTARNACDRELDTLHYAANDRKVDRKGTWRMNLQQVFTALETVVRRPWEKPIADLIAKFQDADAAMRACRDEANELEKLYTGWARFFIVPGGHIHSSRRCSTCYPTTMFGWLPALSGLTEADAVAAHGPLLCSVCFPLAPVEWTVGPQSKKTYCEGTGKAPKPRTDGRSYMRYGACTACSKTVAITTTGAVRAHQP